MKKLIMMLALLMAVGVSAEAQKKEKKDKKQLDLAQYREDMARNEIMLRTMNFQFIPKEVQARTSKIYLIIQYQYLRFYPNAIQVKTEKFDPAERLNVTGNRFKEGEQVLMGYDGNGNPIIGTAGSSPTDEVALLGHIRSGPALRNMMPFEVESAAFEVEKNEPGKEEGTWLIILKTQYESALLTFIITVRTATGNCYVKVESNKEETWMYKGRIAAN